MIDALGFPFERYEDLPVLADWLEDAGEGRMAEAARWVWSKKKRPMSGTVNYDEKGNSLKGPTTVYYLVIDAYDENLADCITHRIRKPRRGDHLFSGKTLDDKHYSVEELANPANFRISTSWFDTELEAIWALIQDY